MSSPTGCSVTQWLKDAKPFDFEITGLYADSML